LSLTDLLKYHPAGIPSIALILRLFVDFTDLILVLDLVIEEVIKIGLAPMQVKPFYIYF
jgi:hypothetical protein